MFSREAAEIERIPPVRPFADEQGVVADVAEELDRGEPVIALLANGSQSERSDLFDRLHAHLAWKGTRVIQIDGAEGAPVDVRRLCHLLVAASSAGAIVGDPAEHLASILTVPRAGERSLALIVENADALSPDALAFVARLAVASNARPLRMQALLLGSRVLPLRLAGVGPVAVKRLDGLPVPSFRPPPVRQRALRLRLALAAVGCLAGVAVLGAVRSGDNDRLSAETGAAVEAPPALASASAAFAGGEASPMAAPSESAAPFPTTVVAQSVPRHSEIPFAPPEGAASPPADVAPRAGGAVSGHAPEARTTAAGSSAESAPQPEAEEASMTVAELLAQSDALLVEVKALLARGPAEGAAPPDAEASESPAAPLEPPPTPVPAAETASPSATETAAAPRATAPPADPMMHAEPPPAPMPPAETAVPSAAVTADDARPTA
ncbi:MAG: hypothetical protein ICV73_14210, partial [Acetobacteraceae bacterium]|nr:hypothetical protein [Acetobacteraceae bacterium]